MVLWSWLKERHHESLTRDEQKILKVVCQDRFNRCASPLTLITDVIISLELTPPKQAILKYLTVFLYIV